ncbi:olfactory receptor 10AG1-like [Dendropsophus ebraccatus]|uniref:olfactory receptor 10AG1-like n=1 Tax=Dendropsophus ebraccatus TaxID=150705 RepID=UPI00383178A0
MERGNNTQIHDFILVGFSINPPFQYIVFVIFLLIFMISLLSHMFIILIYIFSPSLHTPMYFFLANFSFMEICYLFTLSPQMLINLLSEHKTITFYGCAMQMNCFLLLGSAECYLLATMAYDRYNAICHPLLYNTIIRDIVCIRLVIASWIIGTTVALLETNLIFSLQFCRSNRINNFYCDISPLLNLACNNTEINEIILRVITIIVVVIPFILIVISYTKIIWTILKHYSAGTRKKAFSTCTSHLIVVSMSYGSGTIMYLRPKSRYGTDEDKYFSILYVVIAPLMGPFIYSLRNNDVINAVKKIIAEIKTEH